MTLSMGSVSGCDSQYLFVNDVLGYTSYTSGHTRRHSKIYRDLLKVYKRLRERVNTFKDFHEDTVNKNLINQK